MGCVSIVWIGRIRRFRFFFVGGWKFLFEMFVVEFEISSSFLNREGVEGFRGTLWRFRFCYCGGNCFEGGCG